MIVFTAVYGIDTGHHKVFAERLAERLTTNTTVMIPDLFRGTPILQPWIDGSTGTTREVVGVTFGFPGMLVRLRQYSPSKSCFRTFKSNLLGARIIWPVSGFVLADGW